jgi:hypothetical protein
MLINFYYLFINFYLEPVAEQGEEIHEEETLLETAGSGLVFACIVSAAGSLVKQCKQSPLEVDI